MTYATMMVHLNLGQANDKLLKTSGLLAKQFNARLVGIAASQPAQFAYADGYTGGEVIAACRDEIDKEMLDAEAEFRAALEARNPAPEWRSTYTCSPLPEYLAGEARSADLIITSAATAATFDNARHSSIGDLVMRAGRPVLIVPGTAPSPPFNRVVVAWKDTREARRAIQDALPLLKTAADVTIIEIASEDDIPAARARVDDVVRWLKGHGIKAGAATSLATGDDPLSLDTILEAHEADLVVAGAYGHSRLREWAFGGVTAHLLHGYRCALLSH